MMFDSIPATSIKYYVKITVATKTGDEELEYEGESYELFLTKIREFQQKIDQVYKKIEGESEMPF